MKLYISCDMEGVAGVCAWQQVDARNSHPEYEIYRRYYTQEVKAAVAGARAAGVTEFLVNDSHGPMRNLDLEAFDSDVRVIFGNRKTFSMVQDADAGFAGAFFVGYHGGAGDADAVLCHTYTPSVIYEVRLNGMRCSEATLNAALLGYYGVPLLMITGDRTTVEDVRSQMPWVHGAIVKESIGNFAANTMLPGSACELIRAAAAEAVQNVSRAQLFRVEPPVTLDVDLVSAAQAHLVATIPGFERVASRGVRFVHDDYAVVFKSFVATWRLGGQA
ncbi:MAG: M55 family metallopeptidase [Candidatus Eremiobacteraeota bacterium]|nr:M55 family metallopeptidase [Candidatus Eremiobacteraeota bacterium]MBV9056233.1 M55 family metallopeptidase [Candidatus Eremiobacteraeota bacterium]